MKIRVSNSLFVILVSAVLWQPVSAAADSYDPPARVARLSYSRGSVSFQPAGDSEWVDAVLNLPIVTGDNLWAGENSRAEVRIGSKAIRLDHDTEISFAAAQLLDDAVVRNGLANHLIWTSPVWNEHVRSQPGASQRASGVVERAGKTGPPRNVRVNSINS